MKKLKNLIYFTPLAVCLFIILAAWVNNVLYFTDYTLMIFNLTVMLLAGVVLCKGKVWGAYFAIAFYTVWSVWDYFAKYLPSKNNAAPFGVVNIHFPVYGTAVYVIIFYLYCVYKIKTDK
ncbi:MAG: hypothetical protein IJN69_04360 [Oscillospiraceae bacterium]|nr:hypothetical protein [Oscillospiraceae bacterium]